MLVVIVRETLQAFTRPGLDLQTGEIIELEAEPAPVQLELFATDRQGMLRPEHQAGER
jgi:hypothetical protein